VKLDGHVYCEGPDCENHMHIGPDRFDAAGKIASLPPGFVKLTWYGAREDTTYLFCDTECAMKWCATVEPPTELEAL
jgi:hypothetical protein